MRSCLLGKGILGVSFLPSKPSLMASALPAVWVTGGVGYRCVPSEEGHMLCTVPEQEGRH